MHVFALMNEQLKFDFDASLVCFVMLWSQTMEMHVDKFKSQVKAAAHDSDHYWWIIDSINCQEQKKKNMSTTVSQSWSLLMFLSKMIILQSYKRVSWNQKMIHSCSENLPESESSWIHVLMLSLMRSLICFSSNCKFSQAKCKSVACVDL